MENYTSKESKAKAEPVTAGKDKPQTQKTKKERPSDKRRKQQVSKSKNRNLATSTKADRKLNPYQELYKTINEDTSEVTIAMVSWYRFDRLIETLNNLENITNGNINLCLQVQGWELLSEQQIEDINEFETRFKSTYIFFTNNNVGTGTPRYNTTSIASSKFPGSKFTLIIDDDMFIPENSIEKLMKLLKDNPFLGAAALWCKPNYNGWYIREGILEKRTPFPDVDYVDAMGSGTMMVKNEVFNSANFDPKYQIGFVDFDFCLSIKTAGWNLAILALDDICGYNDNSSNTMQYKKERNNRNVIKESYRYFKQKWNIGISDGEKFIKK